VAALLPTVGFSVAQNTVNWMQLHPQTSPPARAAPAMDYDSVRNQVVVFGGSPVVSCAGCGYFTDTWVWDGANWAQKLPQTSPPPNAGAGVFDVAHSKFLATPGYFKALRHVPLRRRLAPW